MNDKKKIIIVIIALILIVGICLIIFNNKNVKEKFNGKKITSKVITTAVKVDEVIPAGYTKTLRDTINSISLNDSISTIKSNVGKVVKNSDSLYSINYSDTDYIKIQYSKSGSILYVSANYNYYSLIDTNVDFSKDKDFKDNYSDLTYIDIKDAFKTDGIVCYKSTTSTEYVWVNNKGEYIRAAFDKDNKCVSYTGILNYN